MLKQVRRILMVVAGVTVLLIGIAMIVLPGPAIVVIPVGLAMLGTEFAWARWLNKKMKAKAMQLGQAIRGGFPVLSGEESKDKSQDSTEKSNK